MGELDNEANSFTSVYCLGIYCLLVTSLDCFRSLDLQVDSSWGNKGSVMLQHWKIEQWDDTGTLTYLFLQMKQLRSFILCGGSFFLMFDSNSFMQSQHIPVLYPAYWNRVESPVASPFSSHSSDPHPYFVFGDREMFPRPYASSLNRASLVLQQPKVSWPSKR